MKKSISILLVIALCWSLYACGNTETTATPAEVPTTTPTETPSEAPTEPADPKETTAMVYTNEGETVEICANEMISVYDGNEARFYKLYGGATIEFVGTVKFIRVKTDVYNGNSVSTRQNMIMFEEGWCLVLGSGTQYDLAEFYPGQKLRVTTGIINPAFHSEYLQKLVDNSRSVWLLGNDRLWDSTYNQQETVIEIVE